MSLIFSSSHALFKVRQTGRQTLSEVHYDILCISARTQHASLTRHGMVQRDLTWRVVKNVRSLRVRCHIAAKYFRLRELSFAKIAKRQQKDQALDRPQTPSSPSACAAIGQSHLRLRHVDSAARLQQVTCARRPGELVRILATQGRGSLPTDQRKAVQRAGRRLPRRRVALHCYREELAAETAHLQALRHEVPPERPLRVGLASVCEAAGSSGAVAARQPAVDGAA